MAVDWLIDCYASKPAAASNMNVSRVSLCNNLTHLSKECLHMHKYGSSKFFFFCSKCWCHRLYLCACVDYVQQQQASVYAQPQTQTAPVYGQLSVQQTPATAQQAAYGVPTGQQTAYGQPATQQPLPQPAYGQPAGGGGQTVLIQHTTPAYGQSVSQQGPPGYGTPAPQPASAAAYGQPPPVQPAAAYGQPPQVQLPPPPQQTVYVLPSAGPQPVQYGLQPPAAGQPQPRPAMTAPPYGRPMSPAELVNPYDQRSVNFAPGGRGPPGALVGPSVVLNAGVFQVFDFFMLHQILCRSSASKLIGMIS